MARSKQSRSIALPWERNSGGVRGLFTASGWRFGVLLVALIPLALFFERRASNDARMRVTRASVASAHRAVWAFRDREGRCPHSLDELLRPPTPGSRDLRELPTDGWGHLLYVRCHAKGSATDVEVISAGPSGSFQDDDNVQ